jgi:hypothetical protein
MVDSASAPAIAGRAVDFRASDIFQWLFSGPFEHQNDFTPLGQVVPREKGDRQVFVDEASGECFRSQLKKQESHHPIYFTRSLPDLISSTEGCAGAGVWPTTNSQT